MKRHFFTFLIIIALYVPILVHGEDYAPLVGIPGVDPSADFSGYINSLYALSISIAALLAVIKIVIAGVKWMMTDIIPAKGEAKKDIQGALIGLLIVLAAVLILTVINPDLVNVNLTLSEPGAAAFASSTAAAATLDATKIKTFGVPGSTASVSYMDSTDSTQEVLFAKSCAPTVSGFTDPQVKKLPVGGETRCITYKNTEIASLWPGTKELCEKVEGNTGKYAQDPVVKTMGYCVWKKP